MNRVLIAHPFGIGDVLFATPLIRAVKESGASRVDVLLGSRTAEVFKHSPYVDEVIPVFKDELKKQMPWRRMAFFLHLLGRLREKKYDTLIDLSLTREYALWSWILLGIRMRAGFDFKGRGNFLTTKVSLGSAGFSGKHVLQFYADLAGRLGVRISDLSPEWYAGRDADQETDALFRKLGSAAREKFIVIAPGGGASWGRDAVFKRWAPEKFARLAALLAPSWGISDAVVAGSGDEEDLCRRVVETCPLRTVHAYGKLSLTEMALLFRRASCFLGNDGGLLHVAKSVRCPTITFFGPVDPAVYGPYPRTAQDAVLYKEELECRPCYRGFRYNSACTHRTCLTELSVEEALTKLKTHPLFTQAQPVSS